MPTRLKSPFQMPSKILNLLIMRPPHIKTKVPIMFLTEFCIGWAIKLTFDNSNCFRPFPRAPGFNWMKRLPLRGLELEQKCGRSAGHPVVWAKSGPATSQKIAQSMRKLTSHKSLPTCKKKVRRRETGSLRDRNLLNEHCLSVSLPLLGQESLDLLVLQLPYLAA